MTISSNSSRINKLISLVNPQHQLIFDLCCDHGKIGLGCADGIKQIYLIDQVESIIAKIKSSDIPKKVTSLTADAINFKFESNLPKTIILAGIGGHLAIKILENIFNQVGASDELILCAHSHEDIVWDFICEKDQCSLIEGDLVEDQGHVYEIYKFKFVQGTLKRELIFEKNFKLAFKHIKEKIDYYSLKAKHDSNYSELLEYYRNQLNSLKIA